MTNLKINNINVSVPEGTTILEAAKTVGIHIPTLCHLDLHNTKMVNQVGSCRVCVVEQEGKRNLSPSCSTVCTEGMVITTNTPRAIKARRTVLELILSNHPKDCLICERNGKCELQSLAAEMGIREDKFEGKRSHNRKDVSSKSLIRCPDKCILCRRCETMCNKVQTVGVYSAINRGFDTVIGTAYDNDMCDTACTFCGQCVSVCPTGALTQVDNTSEVWSAINNPDKFVVVQTAPAVRVALGEMFDMPVGTSVTGKMTTALKRLGFDKVYDTNFGADLTIMEEATEFLERFKKGGKFPMLTSCCPAWVKFIEHQFPDLLDIPSTAKSPHEMLGVIAKTYAAEKLGIDPKKMVVVSVMPCLAKKYEAARPELGEYVDYVLSTRELARMITEANIDFPAIPDSKFDDIMGESSGAADIFGTTGGVAEAAIRTASAWLNNGKPAKIDWTEIRGIDGIREAEVDLGGGVKIKTAIANGLGNVRTILEQVQSGEKEYHLIEVMACPGGCVGGGGQPYYLQHDTEVLKKRAAALYTEDKDKTLRLSNENPEIISLYKEFLGEPGSHKAHELLHTTYVKRG